MIKKIFRRMNGKINIFTDEITTEIRYVKGEEVFGYTLIQASILPIPQIRDNVDINGRTLGEVLSVCHSIGITNKRIIHIVTLNF